MKENTEWSLLTVTQRENWAFIDSRYKSYWSIGMTTGSFLLWLPSVEHGREKD